MTISLVLLATLNFYEWPLTEMVLKGAFVRKRGRVISISNSISNFLLNWIISQFTTTFFYFSSSVSDWIAKRPFQAFVRSLFMAPQLILRLDNTFFFWGGGGIFRLRETTPPLGLLKSVTLLYIFLYQRLANEASALTLVHTN